MNWKKPTLTNHPPFKQMVIGLQLPNKVELVKLDRIDENGPVFVSARGRGLLSEFVNIFGNNSEGEIFTKEVVKIDMYFEIELPEESKQSAPKKEKESSK